MESYGKAQSQGLLGHGGLLWTRFISIAHEQQCDNGKDVLWKYVKISRVCLIVWNWFGWTKIACWQWTTENQDAKRSVFFPPERYQLYKARQKKRKKSAFSVTIYFAGCYHGYKQFPQLQGCSFYTLASTLFIHSYVRPHWCSIDAAFTCETRSPAFLYSTIP